MHPDASMLAHAAWYQYHQAASCPSHSWTQTCAIACTAANRAQGLGDVSQHCCPALAASFGRFSHPSLLYSTDTTPQLSLAAEPAAQSRHASPICPITSSSVVLTNTGSVSGYLHLACRH